MLTRVKFGEWVLDVDVAATRALYRQLTRGWAEQCDCTPCRNFAAQRGSVFPASALSVFEQAGVDPTKEHDVVHRGRQYDGRHYYAGCFLVHARLIQDPDMPMSRSSLIDTLASFSLSVGRNLSIAPMRNDGQPLLQLDFAVFLPWVVDEPFME